MSAYITLREAWVMDRPLVIDSGHRHRREVERRHGLRQLVTHPGDVLERHRRDIRAGADVVTTATWGIAAATLVSPEPDRWMTIARRGVRLARLAIAAHRRVGKVAVGFSIDSTVDAGAISRLVDLFHAERPDFLILDARSPRQPQLDETVRALESARLPLWLSMPRAPHSIDWLERRGKRTRLVNPGLIEITRW